MFCSFDTVNIQNSRVRFAPKAFTLIDMEIGATFLQIHSVHLPKYRDLTGPQFLGGVPGKEGVIFFRGGCSLYKKNKLKSETFNNKKSL